MQLLVFFAILTAVSSAPVKNSSNADYDQTQSGKYNIRADLENFVIVVMPVSSQPTDILPSEVGSAGNSVATSLLAANLFDLFKKLPASKKKIDVKQVDFDDSLEEEDEEQDTAVSRLSLDNVDLSKTKHNLSKLHPEYVDDDNSSEEKEVMIANSPSVSLMKKPQRKVNGRFSRALVLTIGDVKSDSEKKGMRSSKKETLKKKRYQKVEDANLKSL